jgi:DNA-binding NtrC family response regulator
MNAIVVDDDDLIRTLLKRILERRRYTVTLYDKPGFCDECRCEIVGKCADVIISDVEMSDGNGLKLAQQQAQKGCQVEHHALMSGAWTDEQIQKAEALGWKIFPKPFEIDDLNNWLQECEKSLLG